MSVASTNPFQVLSDEPVSSSEPVTSTKNTESKEQPKANKEAPKAGQKGKPSGPASRGGRYYARGGGAKGGPREENVNEETPAREGRRNGEEGGRGRGRGKPRGDRGRGGPGGRGRPFDRHSATGKTDSEKKVHQGWGGDDGKTEQKIEEEGEKDAGAEANDNSWAEKSQPAAENGSAAPEATPAENERRPPREEEEDNTLTLDQYLAKQKEKNTAIPKLEDVRKANDGEDSVFKDAVAISKQSEDEYFVGKSKTAPKQKAKTEKEKVFLTIDGPFASERAPRGGRGGGRGDREGRGRGGGRGRGARGRARGDYHGANGNAGQVDVADQNAFPSLTA